jgi:hypothetical protein
MKVASLEKKSENAKKEVDIEGRLLEDCCCISVNLILSTLLLPQKNF